MRASHVGQSVEAAVGAGREMQFDMEAFLGVLLFARIFVEHDDDLSEIVQFRDGLEIIHRSLPLLVGTCLEQSRDECARGQSESLAYVQEATVANDVQERMHVRFAREVQARANVPTGTLYTFGIAKQKGRSVTRVE